MPTLDLEIWVDRGCIGKIVGARGSMINEIKSRAQCEVAVVRTAIGSCAPHAASCGLTRASHFAGVAFAECFSRPSRS